MRQSSAHVSAPRSSSSFLRSHGGCRSREELLDELDERWWYLRRRMGGLHRLERRCCRQTSEPSQAPRERTGGTSRCSGTDCRGINKGTSSRSSRVISGSFRGFPKRRVVDRSLVNLHAHRIKSRHDER